MGAEHKRHLAEVNARNERILLEEQNKAAIQDIQNAAVIAKAEAEAKADFIRASREIDARAEEAKMIEQFPVAAQHRAALASYSAFYGAQGTSRVYMPSSSSDVVHGSVMGFFDTLMSSAQDPA